MKPETKLGIFTVLGIIVLGFSLYFLGGFSITSSYDLKIKFNDVSGLPVKAAIKLSGVEVGKVRSINIEDGEVVVIAQIYEDVPIYKGAQFSVVMTGIIGSKYLKVVQGAPSLGAYEPGAYVTGVEELPMDVMIAQTMESVKSLADSVNNQGAFGAKLNETMTDVRNLAASVNELVVSMKPYLSTSAQNLDHITSKLNGIVESIDNQDGVIGSLIKDKEMKEQVKESVSSLKETMTEVKTFVGKMSRFRIYWNYDFFYMPKPGLATSDLALEVYPSSGYTFYRAGIANIGNEDDSLDSKDYLEKNKFDLRFGLFNEWGSVAAGLIRGSGGVAVSVKPFYEHEFLQRFVLGAEFSDWGRDRYINRRLFDKPNLAYGVDFRVNQYFSVGAWARDVLETNNFAIKANISFNDQDISSFFGIAAATAI